MEFNKPYFYTATIVDWNPLLLNDRFKEIIIGSLKYLSGKNLINVYGFVIMPNHIHLIWEMLRMEGKEKPFGSFMKFTGHEFLDEIKKTDVTILSLFKVETKSRKHQFWQRDPMTIELYSDKVFEQKLDYIYNNPVQGKWSLAEEPIGYKYSSARFYETEIDEFGFLKHCSNWR